MRRPGGCCATPGCAVSSAWAGARHVPGEPGGATAREPAGRRAVRPDRSFRLHADATVVIPMDFLRVPLTAAAGWLIYSERLDVFTVLGAALILTGNLLNLKPNPSTKASAPS